MTEPRDTLRERLYFIDFLLFFTGQVTRKDLVTRFGISEPAATKDLGMFSEMAPDMLQYDVRQKCYVLSRDKPHFEHQVNPSLYSLAGERAVAFDSGHAYRLPSWVMHSIKRKMDVELVAKLTRAMHQGRAIQATYYSMTHGGDRRSLLSPLALVHDGLRWHLRCFSHDHQEFRDYNLSRFAGVEDAGQSPVKLEDDHCWKNKITLELVPHPRATHPETIRLDYDIKDEALSVSVPLCVAPYFLQHWRVDVTDAATGNPSAQHLYLRNREEAIQSRMPKWIFNLKDKAVEKDLEV